MAPARERRRQREPICPTARVKRASQAPADAIIWIDVQECGSARGRPDRVRHIRGDGRGKTRYLASLSCA